MSDFFEQIKALVPWLSPREASDALGEVEVQLFDQYPEYLELLNEAQQNAKVIEAFKRSHHVIRH